MAAEKKSKSDATPQGAAGSEEVQRAFDAAEDKGYFGQAVDPTPRAAYSVAGQLSAMPVPETDPKAAADAAETARKLGSEEVLPE
jgi:hypothetical protein